MSIVQLVKPVMRVLRSLFANPEIKKIFAMLVTCVADVVVGKLIKSAKSTKGRKK